MSNNVNDFVEINTKIEEKKNEEINAGKDERSAVSLDTFQSFPCKWTCENYFPGISYEFGRVGVIGDGSCFFHSMCIAMYPKYFEMKEKKQRQDFVMQLRCDIGNSFTQDEYDKLHKSKYPFKKKEFQETKDSFCSLTTWADESIIRYFSKKFKINILFIDYETKEGSFYCGVHGDDSIGNTDNQWNNFPLILIAWIHNTHFEPICVKDEENQCYRFYFDPKVRDSKLKKMNMKIINEVKKKYKNQCKI